MNAKDGLTILATWVGVVAAIVGGYAAYLQYEKSVAQQVDQRSLTAIEFVIQFQSEHFMPLREKIYSYIFCSSQEACASSHPSNSQVFAFIEFFDSIKYCADRNICDAQFVMDVFGPYATWHWPCLQPYVKSVRNGEKRMNLARPYGHGLETLVLSDAGNGHCGNLKSY